MSPRRVVPLLAAALTAVAVAAAPASAATPKRIVALTPFSANTLMSIGVTPKAVGQIVGEDALYSKRLAKVPVLQLTHPNGPNLEKLAVVNPDLVFSSPTWAKGTSTMKSLNIDVKIREPQKVSQVPAMVRAIGKDVGQSARAEKKAKEQAQAIATAKKRAKKSPSVLLILGVGRTPYAFLPNSWGGDLVTQAGGKLITSGLKDSSGFARISNEYVVQQNPDIIIAVPHGNANDIASITDYLKTNPAWQDTNAVKNGRLYVSTDDTLLQPWDRVATSIVDVQKKYLKNT
jgi:iron complex transport system substrate-binding protein